MQMALRRTLAHHFLDLANPTLLSRILHCRPIFQPALPLARFPLPVGDQLIAKIRLDMISQSPTSELMKMLRISQIESVRSRLSTIPRISISHSEFLRICREESNADETASAIAQSLEESAAVISLGNIVFIRPGEVVRELEKVITLKRTNREQVMKELKEMEAKKAEIDKKAAAAVRRELWCGLGFLLVQTLGFLRLTFWELSWDVMEPVCFYVTSSSFMAGYSFFLKTSRDPSFEGFFEIRFAAKQKRLLRDSNFDLRRFNELKQQASFFPRSDELDSAAALPQGAAGVQEGTDEEIYRN